ncbi:MAG: DUF1800 domain-containing protein [Nocardioidaceae bacterium]
MITRRSALFAGAVTATAVLPATSATASAGTLSASARSWLTGDFEVPVEHQNAIPDPQDRHLLSRFTAAVTAERIADVEAAGGADAWFRQQLSPGDIPDHAADDLRSWFPVLDLTPLQRRQRYQAGEAAGWMMMQDLASWVMLRRLTTRRQVEELMVDFWSNLLHVASPSSRAWVWRIEYEQMVRRHAFGRFDDLLQDAVTHPSMGLYLDNVESTAEAVNENLGRELLEVHTVGVDAGYTEKDVVDSARILTGFRVDTRDTWDASYAPEDHWVGYVKVLGFSAPNADEDGRPVLARYLSYLAHHPATAERLCRRLAVRFVSDTPSHQLVESLAAVYLDADTDIVPVLRALVDSDEFRGSEGRKVRTPVEDAVATWAAVRVEVTKPNDPQDGANQLIDIGKAIGQVVYDWPAPNGFPDVADAWSGAGRMLGSMRAHWSAASGFWPQQGVSFPPPMAWMPPLPATFGEVVDFVVRSMLYVECSAKMLNAACVATGIGPHEVIDKDHALLAYKLPRLLVSILDTPEHLSR